MTERLTNYIYLGDACNLGRHGPVEHLGIIALNEQEQGTVLNNPLFVSLGANGRLIEIEILVGDGRDSITAGAAQAKIKMPCSMVLTGVKAVLQRWKSESGAIVLDINKAGVSILSTKLSIDQDEQSSETAAVPAVVSDRILSESDEITVDIDTAAAPGVGFAMGLRVYLIGASTSARVRITPPKHEFGDITSPVHP
jgi:hypothetical protein